MQGHVKVTTSILVKLCTYMCIDNCTCRDVHVHAHVHVHMHVHVL